MEIKQIDKENALCLARKIAILNAELIYYEKNKLMLVDTLKLNELKTKREKMELIIKSDYPKTNINLILANVNDNKNHDLTKIDVDLLRNELLESLERKENGGERL